MFSGGPTVDLDETREIDHQDSDYSLPNENCPKAVRIYAPFQIIPVNIIIDEFCREPQEKLNLERIPSKVRCAARISTNSSSVSTTERAL
jgi:hypothetical protein